MSLIDEVLQFDTPFTTAYKEHAAILDILLKNPTLKSVEKERINELHKMNSRGVGVIARRCRSQHALRKLVSKVEAFIIDGPRTALSIGSQRGGDFLSNQLRGQWAEQVVLSLQLPGLVLHPFGPSSAAMPGAEDHTKTVSTFRLVTLVEGKRPDLLAFKEGDWNRLTPDEKQYFATWPERLLTDKDKAFIKKAYCAIEVKNSTWHYTTRRDAGGGPLSVTVKEEEISALLEWETQNDVPIVFCQVLFDEVHCMSFRRMNEAKERGYMCEQNDCLLHDQSNGKSYHRFFLPDNAYKIADVVFPDKSEGVVQVLRDGNVIPYIKYSPAATKGTIPAVLTKEVSFSGRK